METEEKALRFLLVGNGPYFNRGCEAITLGTKEILNNTFGDVNFTSVNFGKSPEAQWNNTEIKHHAINIGRYSSTWFVQNALQTIRSHKTWFPIIGSSIKNTDMVLALGGDNYSMDYGSLRVHLAMIDYATQHNRPFAIWGGSVGPFNKKGTQYEQYVAEKLKKVTAILARETVTIDYLARLGITKNVHLVADPAFVMKPIAPTDEISSIEIPSGAIGLNFSPLMARYLTNGNIEACQEIVVSLIQKLLKKFDRPIILVPHVFTPFFRANDHAFLNGVASAFAKSKADIRLLPSSLSAPELKWVISKLYCFAGARTHSTIAAISAGIPTLSFSYSIKSIGINQDVFGHKDFVLSPKSFSIENTIDIFENLINDNQTIRQHLNQQLPIMRQRAYDAGTYLKHAMYDKSLV